MALVARRFFLLGGLLVMSQVTALYSCAPHPNAGERADLDVAALHNAGYSVSDRRVKVNVKDVDPAGFIAQLERIQLHSYDYVSDHFRSNRRFNGTQIGFIAQELKDVVPESVTTVDKIKLRPGSYTEDEAELNDFHVIDTDVIYTMNVGVTQELIREARVLQGTQEALSAKLEEMEDRIGGEVSAQLAEKRRIAEAEIEKVVEQGRVQEEIEAVRLTNELKLEELRANASLAAIRAQAELEHANSQYEDNLTRSRLEVEHAAAEQRAIVEHQRARDRNAELVQLQEDAQQRQEALRVEHDLAIATATAEFERDAKVEAARIESEAKIRQERENEDVQTRKLKAQWEADKEKVREAALASLTLVGTGIQNFLRSPSSVISLVLTVAGVAAAVYAIREVMRIASAEITRRLSQPPLIRESSMAGSAAGELLRRLFCCCLSTSRRGNLQKTFDGVVLNSGLETQLKFYAASIRNTRSNRAPMRHMLFYGPPGTGKTMLAKRLAVHSGMNYAIMSGGDIAPLGADGVTKLHEIFDWANRAAAGLILFIDEAEAFVGTRNNNRLSESVRNAISAILYHTGTQQTNFMLVLATNRPGDLDSAVVDRIDEAVEFTLPGQVERRRLVQLYFHDYITKYSRSFNNAFGLRRIVKRVVSCFGLFGSTRSDIRVEGITEAVLQAAADDMAGLSAREISKLLLGLQARVYGSCDCFLNAEVLQTHLSAAVQHQKRKRELVEKGVTF